MNRARVSLLVFAILGVFSAGLPVQAASYTRLFYYIPGPMASAAVLAHSNVIDVLAPQIYELDATGKLTGTTSPTITQFSALPGKKVMPLVTNGSFQSSVYQAILKNSSIQTAAINALVAEAKARGYWGWQIDFESMNAEYRDLFSLFISRAAIAMHQNGLVLSVAVAAHVSDNPADYAAGVWQNFSGVFDYPALAANADFLSVMSYDQSDSGGPITSFPWLKSVLSYSLGHVPAAKISLGIPLYYWEWNTRTGTRVDIGGNQSLTTMLQAHAAGASFFYSATNQEAYFTFKSGGIPYSVWYENTDSIAAKVALVKKFHLAGFSAWRLGLEAPGVYSSF